MDLVETLVAEKPKEPSPQSVVRLADYCGFFGLDEAREARDRLREQQIVSDIVIREAPDSDPEGPIKEEFWLRVDRERVREVHAIVDNPEPPKPSEGDGGFDCSECGHHVASEESFCPGCGARFEES